MFYISLLLLHGNTENTHKCMLFLWFLTLASHYDSGNVVNSCLATVVENVRQKRDFEIVNFVNLVNMLK